MSPAGSLSSSASREVSPSSYQGARVSPYGLTQQDSVSTFCMGATGHSKEMESIAEQETTVSLDYGWRRFFCIKMSKHFFHSG